MWPCDIDEVLKLLFFKISKSSYSSLAKPIPNEEFASKHLSCSKYVWPFLMLQIVKTSLFPMNFKQSGQNGLNRDGFEI